jgi:16S rRNA (adenine1518-N6/adenine1519-N6)-dimethyltransferase
MWALRPDSIHDIGFSGEERLSGRRKYACLRYSDLLGQRLGQHFLRSPGILRRIAEAACIEPTPLVIEIGAGEGALTEHLLEHAGRVNAIEKDPELVRHLRERFKHDDRLHVFEADVLQTDLSRWGDAVIVGNLPYYITSPIIERTLAVGKLLERAVFLIQKEVAERVAAKPGTRDYGFLTVATQVYARTELLFKVPPGAFSPPPKVDSAVIRLTPRYREEHSSAVTDPAPLLAFVGLCFRQKRKTIRNNLAGIFGREALEGIPELDMRAEQLTLEEFRSLYRKMAGA